MLLTSLLLRAGTKHDSSVRHFAARVAEGGDIERIFAQDSADSRDRALPLSSERIPKNLFDGASRHEHRGLNDPAVAHDNDRHANDAPHLWLGYHHLLVGTVETVIGQISDGGASRVDDEGAVACEGDQFLETPAQTGQ